MDTQLEILRVLGSIDATLKSLLALAERRATKAKAAPSSDIADDADLDGKYGNELVRFDPRDWTNGSCKGLYMSDCPAAFLDLLADSYEYFAKKNDESQNKTDKGILKSTFDRRSARRARGWAARVRAGKTPAAATAPGWADDGGSF